MLERTTLPPARSHCEARRIDNVSASYVAKANLSVPERADYAVRWIQGTLEIDHRTGSLASKIFDVSPGTISRALAEYGEPPITITEQIVHLVRDAAPGELALVGKIVGVTKV